MTFRFEILHQDSTSGARLGRVHTAHGSFDTPAFMAVGTRGSVKGLTPDMLRDAGCQIILANTYHLMLRPGSKVVRDLGGLQQFTGFNGPMLTDSGGFQVFSLSDLRDFGENGVNFRSHIDGAMVHLGPVESMQVQLELGADIAMAFDDCPPADCPPERLAAAMDRTIRWAATCRQVHRELDAENRQALFGIVQGGTDISQRRRCTEELLKLDFDGYALGGLAVGEGHQRMVQTIDSTAPLLPPDKPRYLMGVGYPADILEAVKRGVDMFDCVLPTRNGRNGLAFTSTGALRLRNAQFTSDKNPLDASCDCLCCRSFSRGYLRHLFTVGEMLGPTLVSLHNVRFYQRWMLDIRRAIHENNVSVLAPLSSDAGDETSNFRL
jgi:queuine tRNA-ribosyltransferase